MKTYMALAWKELRAEKITSVLILIAVILSSAATTALGQSVGILQSMRIEQAASLNGDRYGTFHQLTEEQNQVLLQDERLTDVGSLINLGSTSLGNSGLTLFLREYQKDALKAYPDIGRIKEGRLPEEKGELALPEDELNLLGFDGAIGDRISLPISVSRLTDDQPPFEYTADFVLTGILESSYVGYANGIVDAVVGEGTAKELLPERYMLYSTDFKTISTGQFQETVYDLANKLQISENQIQYNWILLNALGISYDEAENADSDSGFPFMIFACILVGALILFAAGLVIFNILKVAVTKRIREYGTLRAIGSGRGQLYLLVTVQLLILCGIGLPVGILSGIFSAKGILTAAVGMLNPDIFLAQSTQELNASIAGSGTVKWMPLAVSILITLIFAVMAAFPSARYASRVSPTVAMNGQNVKIKRHHRKQKQIRNFEAFYAGLNLKRNRGRTVITILSIVMSITIFVALQSFTGVLDASREVQEMHVGDYAVTGEGEGISPEEAAKIRDHEQVSNFATTKLSIYERDENGNLPVTLDFTMQTWESFQIAGVDDERLEEYATGLTEEEIEELKEGSACLVENPIPFSYEGEDVERTELKQGDSITVNGIPLRVVGIVNHPVSVNNEGFINGVQVIVSDAMYDTLTGNTGYAEVYPTLKETTDAEQFEIWLDEWCQENPGSHWLSYRQSDAQMAESFEQIRLLCWGLILFIGLIGVLNIINTVYTNIHTRIREIGMQRAIGLSTGSLYKTFLWEGAYYGLIASVIGAVCGYFCTVFVEAATADQLQLVTVPVLPIAEAAAVSVLACMAATAIPLRAIGKMNIVDAIEIL